MVFPGEHCRITTPSRVRNMRGRTEQGALLHLPAIRLGRHHVCIYTTKSRCAVCGELLRKMQPCVRQSCHPLIDCTWNLKQASNSGIHKYAEHCCIAQAHFCAHATEPGASRQSATKLLSMRQSGHSRYATRLTTTNAMCT